MKNNITTIFIMVILAGIISFFGGMKYQESKISAGGRQFQGRGTRANTGEIVSVDDKSIIIKLQDGSSKIVLLNDKIMINKVTVGTRDDLKAGVRVAAFGMENSDGSVTGQNIQLNPMFRNMGANSTTSAAQKYSDAK